MKKDAIEFYNPGLENITLLQVFQEAELRFLDALIESFPIKPEPTQEEVELPQFCCCRAS
jgi:GTP-binding protein